jgi:hypothetical protein
MAKLTIPLTVFMIPKHGKLVKVTLNEWINVHGVKNGMGRHIAAGYKKRIQSKIVAIVDQAMVDGLDPIDKNTKFQLDWYFPNRRTDLDNWVFTHKFIFDAFQASSVRGQVFMPNDNLNFVVATYDDFRGIDKDNPRVEIDWDN